MQLLQKEQVMNQEVKTSDIVWASAEYLTIPLPNWGDDFEEWEADKVLEHIQEFKVDAFKDVSNKKIAHMILSTAVSFREAVREEARVILKELTDVFNSI